MSRIDLKMQGKRDLAHCFRMRTMFDAIRMGDSEHLVKIVWEHFEKCRSCREWADKRGFAWQWALRRPA